MVIEVELFDLKKNCTPCWPTKSTHFNWWKLSTS